MRIDDGYGTMMQMSHSPMVLWVLAIALVLLLIGFGVGYAVGRSR